MKIWLLSSEFPESTSGGIARYVDHIACALVAAGADCLVIGPDSSSLAEGRAAGEGDGAVAISEAAREHRVLPYRKHCFQANFRHFKGVDASREPEEDPAFPFNFLDKDLALAYQIAGEVEALIQSEGPPDVIEIQEYKALGIFLHLRRALGEGFLEGVPLVAHLHTPDFVVGELNQEPHFKIPRYWVGRQERAFILGADAVVAPSHFIAGEIRRMLGCEELPIEVIPYPHAPVEHLATLAERCSACAAPSPGEAVGEAALPQILFVGRLEARKGILPLLRVCRRLWQRGHRFRLRLIGKAVFFHPKRMPFDVFIEKVYGNWIEQGLLELSGACEQEEIQAAFGGAQAVVIPSLWENFPNVCMEAMLAGCPVLASECGGQAELLGMPEPAGGLFFNPLDEEDFMRVLRVALSWDAQARADMGRTGQARVKQFCYPEKIAQERLRHFAEVMHHFRRPTLYPFADPQLRSGEVNKRIPALSCRRGLISVVIPFYNLGEFVEEALDSVRQSEVPDCEILVINDGSTEESSLDVLERLERSDWPGLRVLHKENEGLARARNFGALQAKGEYICFLDADDALEPEFLGRASALLGRYENVHIVAAWARFFGAKKGLWAAWNLEFPYLLAHNLMIPICMVRRSAYLAFGQNNAAMSYGLEDFEGWIRMLGQGCGAVAIPEVLTRYRVREDSMFQVINVDQFLYLHAVIVRENKALYEKFGPELFQLLNANGPCHLWAEPTAWAAPIDTLEVRAGAQVLAECKKTELWWRRSVELQEEVLEAKREAERQWLEGCALRQRLAELDQHAKRQEALIRQLQSGSSPS